MSRLRLDYKDSGFCLAGFLLLSVCPDGIQLLSCKLLFEEVHMARNWYLQPIDSQDLKPANSCVCEWVIPPLLKAWEDHIPGPYLASSFVSDPKSEVPS